MSSTINFITLVGEILSDEFYEPAPTEVEFPFLYEKLKAEYTFDQIVYGYENYNQRKISHETLAELRLKYTQTDNFL